MSQFKQLVIITLVLASSACTFQDSKNKQDNNSSLQRSKIIGKWKQVIDSEDSTFDSTSIIKTIQFESDSTAIITVHDSTVNSPIIGKWKYGVEKKVVSSIIDIGIHSDVELTFNTTKNEFYKLMFIVIEEDDKFFMTSHNIKLEKM